MTKPFYITTAIHYTNAPPHLGHAYENIAADVVARWHRKLGEDVFFLTGTDEHGQKVEKAAIAKGLAPQEFVDNIVPTFTKMNELYDISCDNFIRTTDPHHVELAKNIFKKVLDQGDIYLGEYEGLYCDGCERFLMERDLEDGNCPVHERPPQMLKEPSYFFKMEKYEKRLIEHFDRNKDFVQPKSRYNEVYNRLKDGLLPLSVTRTSVEWGIPVDASPGHIIYVWFDALLNYFSGLKNIGEKNEDRFEEFWPADVHLVGKDINWFHSVIWPCILMAAGYELPKKIFVHGFLNLKTDEDQEARKLSKSSGVVIDPVELAEKYTPDAVRFFLMRETSFGLDGEISIKALHNRINGDLANELGNLVSRTATMVHKFADGKVPDVKEYPENMSVHDVSQALLNTITPEFDNLKLHKALGEAWNLIRTLNRFVDEEKPWDLAKLDNERNLKGALYTLLEGLRIACHYLEPFMPTKAKEIRRRIGAEVEEEGHIATLSEWGRLKAGAPVEEKGNPLFPKVE